MTRERLRRIGTRRREQSRRSRSVRDAGTTPRVLSRPRVGFSPTIPQHAAGTRPEPAVSVPSAMVTIPVATATADPELEPPAMYAGSNGLAQMPKSGARVPTSPVANWSRLVFPTKSAPALDELLDDRRRSLGRVRERGAARGRRARRRRRCCP